MAFDKFLAIVFVGFLKTLDFFIFHFRFLVALAWQICLYFRPWQNLQDFDVRLTDSLVLQFFKQKPLSVFEPTLLSLVYQREQTKEIT